MRGIKLSPKELHAIIINTPKYGAAKTARTLGRSVSSIYYISGLTKKCGYKIILNKPKLTTLQTVAKILKQLKKI